MSASDAEKLALALADKWDEAFEKAYWSETSTFRDTVLPLAQAFVDMRAALIDFGHCHCADSDPGCQTEIEVEAACAAADKILEGGVDAG